MMSYINEAPPSVRRIGRLYVLNQSMHWAIVGLVLPVLSLFVLEKGMGYLELGSLMAIYSGVTAILELPTGGLADSLGRKRVYCAALVANAVGASLLIAASGFAALALGFAFLGLGRALSSGTMEAYFIDALIEADPRVDLQKIAARVGTAAPLALGLASLAGGLLPRLGAKVASPGGPLNAYSLNYVAYLLALALQLTLTLRFVREKRAPARRAGSIVREMAEGFSSFPRVLREGVARGLHDRTILLILLGGCVWGFSISSLEQLWQPQVITIGGTRGQALLGPLSAGYFAAASLGSFLSTGLCRALGRRYGASLGLSRLMMGTAFLLLAKATRLPAFSGLYFLTFAANGLSSSPESAVLNAAIPAERRSTTLSLASLFTQAGGLMGSILLGALAQSRSIGAAWSLAALTLAASSVLYFALPHGVGSRIAAPRGAASPGFSELDDIGERKDASNEAGNGVIAREIRDQSPGGAS